MATRGQQGHVERGLAAILAAGMRRREFIALLGGAALACPLGARAQPANKVYRVGHLMLLPRESLVSNIDALEHGFRDLGYVIGKNLIIEHRSAGGKADRLREVASELVRDNVDVIVTGVNYGIAAAKQETSTIPIVMVYGADPVGMGFVASLRRPGGNVTGGAWEAAPEIHGKNFEMLGVIAPNISRAALLWNADFPGILPSVNAVKDAAQRLGKTLHSVEVRTPDDFNAAYASMLEARDEAFMVLADPLTWSRRTQIPEFAAKHRLPAVYPLREFAEAGGLMSYGANTADYWGRAAGYVDKILKGAKPADLPVEQPTKFELLINLKTAKALGLTIPATLLARADEVIE